MATYQQKCGKCRKNYVQISSWKSKKFVMCYECQKDELKGEIKDPKMKEMFDIPEELYKKSLFLRDIKKNYLRFEQLTEKQVEAFKKTVKKLQEAKTENHS